MKSTLKSVVLLLLILGMSLTACRNRDPEPTPTPEAPTEAPAAAPTEAPTEVPTEEPTEVPTEVPAIEPTEESAETGETESAETELADAPAGLEPEVLANLTYKSEYTQSGEAPLENGAYEEEAAPGSAAKTQISLSENVAYGELNGETAAAVVLVTESGGSGTFYDLAVVALRDGQPVHVASTNLGDRIQLNSLIIENNQIGVDMVTQGPDDAMPDPTQQVVRRYELQDDQLALVDETAAATPESPQEGPTVDSVEHVPDPELVNKTWAWQQRDPNGSDTPAVEVETPEQYTLVFSEEGTFQAQVDCNTTNGGYATFDSGNLVMEPGPTTLAYCGENSLDSQMMGLFDAAQSYRIEEEGALLVFPWAENGPIDYYRVVTEIDLPEPATGVPTGTVTAPNGVNLRTGPSTNYPSVGVATFGDTGEIIGVSEDGTWWVVAAPNQLDGQVWVAAEFVEAANVEDVPVIPAPPLPETPADEETSGTSDREPDEAALADEQPYEVGANVILYSASRVVEDGNRRDEVSDVYAVPAAAGSTPEMVANNAIQPALSPDRGTLAFHSTQSDKLGLGGYDLGTGKRLRFSSFIEDGSPRWSPTGDRIVFASNREGDRAWRIYLTPAIANDDPGQLSAMVLGFGKDPDWHPTDEVIVFKGCNDQGQSCGIYTMPADGSGRTLLTEETSDSMPRWTPDGSAVVFMSEGRDGNWELYRVSVADNVAASAVTRLTDDPAPDGLPAISPDGQQIAFISQRGGAWGLWVMPATSGEATQIAPITGDLPDWLLQSVDWPR